MRQYLSNLLQYHALQIKTDCLCKVFFTYFNIATSHFLLHNIEKCRFITILATTKIITLWQRKVEKAKVA